MKKIGDSLIPLAALIIVGVVVFYALPYLATLGLIILFFLPYLIVYQMKSAVEQQNLDKLADYVDFPALRQNLVDQANFMMSDKMGKSFKSNAFVIFGLNLAGLFTEKMIEVLVTPRAIAELMKGHAEFLKNQGQLIVVEDGRTYITEFRALQEAKLSYKSISRFSIMLPVENEKFLEFILSRSGLEWKLSNIKFLVEATSTAVRTV
ncbi:DUF2939 domain-containing protein [Deltaproteobacteria bacterium TL4]